VIAKIINFTHSKLYMGDIIGNNQCYKGKNKGLLKYSEFIP
jgi:hypothetical protein